MGENRGEKNSNREQINNGTQTTEQSLGADRGTRACEPA